MTHPPFLLVGLAVFAAPLSSSAGDVGSSGSAPGSGGDWEISVSAGPAWRQLGEVKVSAGYRSGGLVLPSLVGGESLVTPAIGETGAYGDREYNDGYVNQDPGTGIDGSTWNWGYDQASQVQGNRLAYTATGYQSTYSGTRAAVAPSPIPSRDLEGVAPHFQLAAISPHHLGPFRLGFSAGIDFLSVDRNFAFSGFSATQTRDDYRLDYVDYYDVDGIVVPQAPYQGSFSGPGPVISNLPSSRVLTSVFLGGETANFSNAVLSSMELSALNITLGPTLTARYGRFDLALAAGFSLNVYNWEAHQEERLSATTSTGTEIHARWTEKDQGVKVRPGVYFQGEATCRLSEVMGITGFTRFDAAKEFSIGAGPTSYQIDPSGVSIGMMLRYMIP